MQAVMPGIHAHKIDAVRRNIPLADGDPLLLEAYQHKIVKEEAAASFVINEPQMRTAISKAEQLVTDLDRSEEHTSELQSLMRTSYAVFCLNKKKQQQHTR